MQRLAGSAIPVPTVRWIDPTSGPLGTPYFVMDRIDDTVTVSDVPPYHQAGMFAEIDDAGRATMWNGCVDMIAAVHRIDPAAHRLGFLGSRTPGPQALAGFLRYALTWAYGDNTMHPTLRRALDWLDAHPFTPDRIGLVGATAGCPTCSTATIWHRWRHWTGDRLPRGSGRRRGLAADDRLGEQPATRPAPRTRHPGSCGDHRALRRVSGHPLTKLRFSDLTAPLLLAVALIRLSEKLAIPGVDLADICAQRVEFILDGD
ncbi:MAG: phosphotransferase [Mycobacterium sp.]